MGHGGTEKGSGKELLMTGEDLKRMCTLRQAADEILPAVAEVATTFGGPPNPLASSATDRFSCAARLPNVLSVVFLPILLCGVMGAGGLSAEQTRTVRRDFPGQRVGAMAFDGEGGLWIAEGLRSEVSTKIYRLQDGKPARTLEVPLRWICSLTCGGGKLWATNARLHAIDPETGEVLQSKELTPPTDRTGLAFHGRNLLLSNRTAVRCAKVLPGADEDPKWSGTTVRCKAGALVFDGEDTWMLMHEHALLIQLGPEGTTGEKGLVIPPEFREHALLDVDWDGESFWVLLRKRLGIRKYDNAVVKVDTVDYQIDSELPHAKVRINYPCEGKLVLQRAEGSSRPRTFTSFPPPQIPEEAPEPEPGVPELEVGEYYLPVGEYRVLEYAWFKTDEQNFKWRVKVTDWGTLEIKADGDEGKVQDFRIATGLVGELKIKPPSMRWQQGRYSLHFSIVDSTGCKVQLVRVLKTAEASFEMRDSNGQKIAGGFFAPGIDSYCGYQVRVPGHAEMPLKVKPFLDSGPIDVKLEDVVIEELP